MIWRPTIVPFFVYSRRKPASHFSDHAYPAAMALARWKAGRAVQASM
jgi:hypothetical protein